MPGAITTPAKYVFLNVVGFTQNRSVEAQSDIIVALNGIVRASLAEYSVMDKRVILSPTGDGICIALLNVEDPYDIHLLLALCIIKRVNDYSSKAPDKMRQFKVRVGLNANTDNLIVDINGNPNIAGAGINMASRVMSSAKGNQIFVSQSVYKTLRQWEKYMEAFVEYVATVKHNMRLPVFHFVQEGHTGLNIDVLKLQAEKLNDVAAYYIAHAIKNRDLIFKYLEDKSFDDGVVILLWFLANDSIRAASSLPISRPPKQTYKAEEANFEEQLIYYDTIPSMVKTELADFIYQGKLATYCACFLYAYDRKCTFISSHGSQKLRTERPDVWAMFELDTFANGIVE